jgi:addiction module HigA family antidote
VAVTPVHPREHLAEELKALDVSAAELARKIAVPTNGVTEILNGARSITGDTALRLGHFFGTSPQFWLNLQALSSHPGINDLGFRYGSEYPLCGARCVLTTLKNGAI